MTPASTTAIPAEPPYTAESAEPPTMKNAGRLSPMEGSEAVGLVIVTLVVGLIATGALLQAVMTNHGRSAKGLALNALAAAAAIGVVIAITLSFGGDLSWQSVLGPGAVLGSLWLALAILAFAVGSIVQPPGKTRRRA